MLPNRQAAKNAKVRAARAPN